MHRVPLHDEIAGTEADLLRVDQEHELAVEDVAVGDAAGSMKADPVLKVRLRIGRRRNRGKEEPRFAGGACDEQLLVPGTVPIGLSGWVRQMSAIGTLSSTAMNERPSALCAVTTRRTVRAGARGVP